MSTTMQHHLESYCSHCSHVNTVIDPHEGTQVCLDCALVLEEYLDFDGSCHLPTTRLDDSVHRQISNNKKKETHWERNLVLDWLANGHIPPIYAADIVDLYKETCNNNSSTTPLPGQLQQSKQIEAKRLFHQNHPYQIQQRESLLALCLYETLKRQEIPRSLKEVCGLTGQRLTNLTLLLKKYFPYSKPIKPEDMVVRYCCRMGISRQDALQIEQGVQRSIKKNHSCTPSTVIASHVVKYVQEHNLKGFPVYEICRAFSTSPISVRRFLKHL